MKKKSPITDLVKELKKYEGYRIGWVANIAMACYDEIRRQPTRSNKNIHKACNKGAEYFLDLLCDKYKEKYPVKVAYNG